MSNARGHPPSMGDPARCISVVIREIRVIRVSPSLYWRLMPVTGADTPAPAMPGQA